MAPVGCAVAPPISGLLTIESIPVLGLVDTGASVTCLGFTIWWRYRAQWGALKQFENRVLGAHGKPLNIAGRTEHLDIQWGEARGRVSFVVIVGLESPPCLIGMDIMRPLRVNIMSPMVQPHRHSLNLRPFTLMRPNGNSHRNGCQHQPLVRLPSLNLQGKNRHQELLSWQKEPLRLPLLSPSDRQNRSLRTGVQLFLPRRTLLPALLGLFLVLPALLELFLVLPSPYPTVHDPPSHC